MTFGSFKWGILVVANLFFLALIAKTNANVASSALDETKNVKKTLLRRHGVPNSYAAIESTTLTEFSQKTDTEGLLRRLDEEGEDNEGEEEDRDEDNEEADEDEDREEDEENDKEEEDEDNEENEGEDEKDENEDEGDEEEGNEGDAEDDEEYKGWADDNEDEDGDEEEVDGKSFWNISYLDDIARYISELDDTPISEWTRSDWITVSLFVFLTPIFVLSILWCTNCCGLGGSRKKYYDDEDEDVKELNPEDDITEIGTSVTPYTRDLDDAVERNYNGYRDGKNYDGSGQYKSPIEKVASEPRPPAQGEDRQVQKVLSDDPLFRARREEDRREAEADKKESTDEMIMKARWKHAKDVAATAESKDEN